MSNYTVTVLNDDRKLTVPEGTILLNALTGGGLHPDAPCGGQGTCKKCKATVNGEEVLTCQTVVDRDMSVLLPKEGSNRILTGGVSVGTEPDGSNAHVLAIDIGTTTVVAYLLDGTTGALVAQSSTLNPQTAFGADVISRIQYVMKTGSTELRDCIRQALARLAEETASKAGLSVKEITLATVVGNTAMHHLFLGIDPKPLTTPPYMPNVYEALELPAAGILPIAENGILRVLPNIAGFVGADTVGCLTAVRFDERERLTLMIDIGTNGEMVLGNRTRRIACSTAAGPAFEGAKISMGMRGAPGAIDHVTLNEDGTLNWHVIGEEKAIGLCGSGLLDLIACLLNNGQINATGRMKGTKEIRVGDTDVVLTQKDVREVQLAKSAIRAGIELMAEQLGVAIEDIQDVFLAGAFGSYMNPASACRIGMIPPVLESKIQAIGNAAGEGAKLAALNKADFDYTRRLGAETEFLELASLPEFQTRYISLLNF